MVSPYSLDFRNRVVAAVENRQTCRAAAELFDVSVASVVKWSQRARVTGSAAAKPMAGKRAVPLAGQRAFIRNDKRVRTVLRRACAGGCGPFHRCVRSNSPLWARERPTVW